MATSAAADAGVDADPLGYYAVLGVEHGATADEIRRAYRRQAHHWHPDRNASPDATERMARINEAYAVLSDPGKRAAYDRGAFTHRKPEPPRPVVYPATVDFGSLRPGERRTRTVRVRNAGGPCSTVRVEPEFGSWFRLAGARGGSSADVVGEFEFEAFADPGAGLGRGRQQERARVFLDDESVELSLQVRLVVAPTSGHTASSTASASAVADPPVVDSVRFAPTWFGRYVERKPLSARLGLAFVTGVLDPFGLSWLAATRAHSSGAPLVLLAAALVVLTAFCTLRTRFFTRIGSASSGAQFFSALTLVLGKASLVLAAVVLLAFVVAIVLAVVIALVLVWAVFAGIAELMSSA